MKLLKSYLVVMATVVAALTAVPIAQAGNPTPAELRALEIRGQALNNRCQNATLSGEDYIALCGNKGAEHQPTAAELRALEIRGEALNHLRDVRAIATSGGFDWTRFGIDAGATLGLLLLGGAVATGVHYGRKNGVRPRPAP